LKDAQPDFFDDDYVYETATYPLEGALLELAMQKEQLIGMKSSL
jgi:hypothetical protein